MVPRFIERMSFSSSFLIGYFKLFSSVNKLDINHLYSIRIPDVTIKRYATSHYAGKSKFRAYDYRAMNVGDTDIIDVTAKMNHL